MTAVIVVGSLCLPSAPVAAQESDDDTEIALAEVPSTGARRPGPVLVASVPVRAPASVPDLEAEATSAPNGVAPVKFVIDDLGIAAPIELGSIVDGAMQDPTGPRVVAWYDQLGKVGEQTNVVMAGHVDYYNSGPGGTPGPARKV